MNKNTIKNENIFEYLKQRHFSLKVRKRLAHVFGLQKMDRRSELNTKIIDNMIEDFLGAQEIEFVEVENDDARIEPTTEGNTR